MNPFEHNIVSLLYAIKGKSESYLEQIEENRFQNLKERSDRAEQIVKKTYLLAEEALKITKRFEMKGKPDGMHGGIGEPETAYFNLMGIWNKTVALVGGEVDMGRIDVINHIPDPFPAIECHGRDLEEILYHVAKNAAQAVSEGGKIIVRAHVGLSRYSEQAAFISISDTGNGIPNEHLKYVFQPFYTTKPMNEGNGMGLFLAKTLVRKNRGMISLSSFIGYGSTFTLEFPLKH